MFILFPLNFLYIARLADLSLLHGDLRLAELCLQRARSYARLSFLYTLTGQADKLGKLVRRWMVFWRQLVTL